MAWVQIPLSADLFSKVNQHFSYFTLTTYISNNIQSLEIVGLYCRADSFDRQDACGKSSNRSNLAHMTNLIVHFKANLLNQNAQMCKEKSYSSRILVKVPAQPRFSKLI
jgi:hypothetical protein